MSVCLSFYFYLRLSTFFTSSDQDSLKKIGEGTYGEAFKTGSAVCKIVPIDGDQLVNGEVQKANSILKAPFSLELDIDSNCSSNFSRDQKKSLRKSCYLLL